MAHHSDMTLTKNRRKPVGGAGANRELIYAAHEATAAKERILCECDLFSSD